MPVDLTAIAEELASLTASTPTQRRTLYRLGRSRWWVGRYAATRTDASRAIAEALATYRPPPGTNRDSPRKHPADR